MVRQIWLRRTLTTPIPTILRFRLFTSSWRFGVTIAFVMAWGRTQQSFGIATRGILNH